MRSVGVALVRGEDKELRYACSGREGGGRDGVAEREGEGLERRFDKVALVDIEVVIC